MFAADAAAATSHTHESDTTLHRTEPTDLPIANLEFHIFFFQNSHVRASNEQATRRRTPIVSPILASIVTTILPPIVTPILAPLVTTIVTPMLAPIVTTIVTPILAPIVTPIVTTTIVTSY
jgi:hypothetical protein